MLYDDDPASEIFRVRGLEAFTLSELMFVNADTLASLQIIEAEGHPNKQMQGPQATGSKESLSVFGLFLGLARTPQGKQSLRQLFLRPSSELEIIRERHHTIQALTRPENTLALEAISKCLRNIKDMRSVVLQLQRGGGNSKKSSFKKGLWGNLQNFSRSVIILLQELQDVRVDRNPPRIFSKVHFFPLLVCSFLTTYSYTRR